jgi:hypothetical protein
MEVFTMATSVNVNTKPGVEKLEKTVTVKFPKTPKDLKELTAGMKMIGWALVGGVSVYFLDKAVADFDKLTKTPEKKKTTKTTKEEKVALQRIGFDATVNTAKK